MGAKKSKPTDKSSTLPSGIVSTASAAAGAKATGLYLIS